MAYPNSKWKGLFGQLWSWGFCDSLRSSVQSPPHLPQKATDEGNPSVVRNRVPPITSIDRRANNAHQHCHLHQHSSLQPNRNQQCPPQPPDKPLGAGAATESAPLPKGYPIWTHPYGGAHAPYTCVPEPYGGARLVLQWGRVPRRTRTPEPVIPTRPDPTPCVSPQVQGGALVPCKRRQRRPWAASRVPLWT